jgi:hypothetical protein
VALAPDREPTSAQVTSEPTATAATATSTRKRHGLTGATTSDSPETVDRERASTGLEDMSEAPAPTMPRGRVPASTSSTSSAARSSPTV